MRINQDNTYNNNFDSVLSIGLMSGTSLDGVDVALIETDGLGKIFFKGNKTYKFPANIRSGMEEFIFKRVNHHKISKIFNDFHIHSVKNFIKNEQLNNKAIKVIGFHGHTIYHNPIENWTWQLGDGKYLSKNLQIPVISNFRYRDVCLGGEGAPLVPVWHHAIINMIEKKKFPCAFINIGGVSNITLFSNIIDIPISFDIGIGNAPLDRIMKKNYNMEFDIDGIYSKRGNISLKVIKNILSQDWFNLRPPKSLDKYSLDNIIKKYTKSLSTNDKLATLSNLISASARKGISFFDIVPETWYLSGGGRLNNSIVQGFKKEFGKKIVLVDDLGLNGDSMEAQAFAYLAVRSMRGLPFTWNNTTGVKNPTSGGLLNFVLK